MFHLLQIEPLFNYFNEMGIICWMAGFEMVGTESLYNKLMQGLYSCQVVLACVTSHFHLSDICKRDIAVAENLGRPVVSLVLGKSNWPIAGDIGRAMFKYDCIKTNIGPNGCIDVNSESVQKLKKCLQKLLNGTSDDVNVTSDNEKQNSQISNSDSRLERQNKKSVKLTSQFKIRSSTSLLEHQTSSATQRKLKQRRRTHADLSMNQDLPMGVEVDADGYTVKSERSQSCVIL